MTTGSPARSRTSSASGSIRVVDGGEASPTSHPSTPMSSNSPPAATVTSGSWLHTREVNFVPVASLLPLSAAPLLCIRCAPLQLSAAPLPLNPLRPFYHSLLRLFFVSAAPLYNSLRLLFGSFQDARMHSRW
jgi:hypothetical protein